MLLSALPLTPRQDGPCVLRSERVILLSLTRFLVLPALCPLAKGLNEFLVHTMYVIGVI